jgi:hypothetical protein
MNIEEKIKEHDSDIINCIETDTKAFEMIAEMNRLLQNAFDRIHDLESKLGRLEDK